MKITITAALAAILLLGCGDDSSGNDVPDVVDLVEADDGTDGADDIEVVDVPVDDAATTDVEDADAADGTEEADAGEDDSSSEVEPPDGSTGSVAVTFTVSAPTVLSDNHAYITSNHGSWDAAWLPMTFTSHAGPVSAFTVTTELPESFVLEYKYTRGAWATVEQGSSCEELENRRLTIAGGSTGTQSVTDVVANWADLCP